MKKVTKQGQVGNIQGFILAIVGVAVVLAVGLIVLAELQTSTTANSEAYNATGTIITKLGTVPTWIGILIVVALAFIVLSFFGGRR
jgi:multisubunit Na+/H+ antiporter MnhB subunit